MKYLIILGWVAFLGSALVAIYCAMQAEFDVSATESWWEKGMTAYRVCLISTFTLLALLIWDINPKW